MRATLAAVLVLAAAPGCCWTRAETKRSLEFKAGAIARHTRMDVRNTAETFGGIPAALARNWDRSMTNLDRTSRLACGE